MCLNARACMCATLAKKLCGFFCVKNRTLCSRVCSFECVIVARLISVKPSLALGLFLSMSFVVAGITHVSVVYLAEYLLYSMYGSIL